MIDNVVPTGSDPGKLLDYLMNEEKDSQLIGGNVIGTTTEQIMQQWEAISKLNPRTKKDTKHISLSPHHTDRLTDEQWLEIGEKMVHGLGYTSNMWLMIKHKPTDNQLKLNSNAQPHVHLMIHTFECESGKFNRVNDWRDKTRAGKLTREIEKEYNLYQVDNSKTTEYKRPSKGQYRRYLREVHEADVQKIDQPKPIVLSQLQSICTEALAQEKDLLSYIYHLEREGVNVRISTQNNQPVGISYSLDGTSFAGSRLGNKFSWTGLKKQQVAQNITDPAIRHYFFKEIDQLKDISPKIYTQQQIEEAASDQPSLKVFIGRLQEKDISIKFKVTRNKVIQGIRYSYMGEEWRSSELKDASLPKLQKVHKVDFNKKRDLALIESVNAGKIIELTDEEKNIKTAEEKNELTENFALLAAEVFNHKAFALQRVKGNLCGTIGSDYYLIYEPKQKTFSVHNQEKGEILTIEIGSQKSTIDGLATTQDVEKFQTVLNELNRQVKKEELVKQSNLKKNQLEM